MALADGPDLLAEPLDHGPSGCARQHPDQGHGVGPREWRETERRELTGAAEVLQRVAEQRSVGQLVGSGGHDHQDPLCLHATR